MASLATAPSRRRWYIPAAVPSRHFFYLIQVLNLEGVGTVHLYNIFNSKQLMIRTVPGLQILFGPWNVDQAQLLDNEQNNRGSRSSLIEELFSEWGFQSERCSPYSKPSSINRLVFGIMKTTAIIIDFFRVRIRYSNDLQSLPKRESSLVLNTHALYIVP